MEVVIDSNVEFNLNGRKAVVDGRELADFKRALFATKGKSDPAKPDEPPTLSWDVILPETQAFIKAKCGIDITPGEATAIFRKADKAWEEIEKNWLPPTEASETSSASTDPRYAD